MKRISLYRDSAVAGSGSPDTYREPREVFIIPKFVPVIRRYLRFNPVIVEYPEGDWRAWIVPPWQEPRPSSR